MKGMKISTALTVVDDKSSREDQVATLVQWSTKIPRMVVMGPINPRGVAGARYVPTSRNPQLNYLLGSYLMDIPGSEVVMIGTPTFKVDSADTLLEHVYKNRMELSWGCYIHHSSGTAFVMAASVLAHMVPEVPYGLTFDQASDWIHNWMAQHMPPHRYFDGSQYGLVETPQLNEQENPVKNAYSKEFDEPKKHHKNKK